MNKIRLQKGITVVELMVVLSIISLISSMVVASVSTARAKSDDAHVISVVEQAQLSFARINVSENMPNPQSSETYFCLGKDGTQTCTFWGATLHGNNTVQSALSGLFTASTTGVAKIIDGLAYDDIVYKCKSVADGYCIAAIYWAQSGNTPCPIGTEVLAGNGGKICGVDAGSDTTTNVETGQTDPFNFTLSSPNTATVQQGSNGETSLSLTLSAGDAESVTFAAQNVPSGLTVSFFPTSCTPDCSTTITVSASSSMAVNNYTIDVVAISQNGVQKTTSFTATVTIPVAPGCTISNPYADTHPTSRFDNTPVPYCAPIECSGADWAVQNASGAWSCWHCSAYTRAAGNNYTSLESLMCCGNLSGPTCTYVI